MIKLVFKNEVMEIVCVNRKFIAYTVNKLKRPDIETKALICKTLLEHTQTVSKYMPKLIENKTNFWKLIAVLNR